jgi:hypothetical protein
LASSYHQASNTFNWRNAALNFSLKWSRSFLFLSVPKVADWSMEELSKKVKDSDTQLGNYRTLLIPSKRSGRRTLPVDSISLPKRLSAAPVDVKCQVDRGTCQFTVKLLGEHCQSPLLRNRPSTRTGVHLLFSAHHLLKLIKFNCNGNEKINRLHIS